MFSLFFGSLDAVVVVPCLDAAVVVLVVVGLAVVRDGVEDTPVLEACELAVGLVVSPGRVAGFGVVVLLVVAMAGDDACVAGFFSAEEEIVDFRSVCGAAGFA